MIRNSESRNSVVDSLIRIKESRNGFFLKIDSNQRIKKKSFRFTDLNQWTKKHFFWNLWFESKNQETTFLIHWFESVNQETLFSSVVSNHESKTSWFFVSLSISGHKTIYRHWLLKLGLIARGSIDITDMRRNIERLSGQLNFVNWNKNGWKVGLCDVPASNQPFSLLGIHNTTAVVDSFVTLRSRFSKLYKRKGDFGNPLYYSNPHFSTLTPLCTDWWIRSRLVSGVFSLALRS